MAKPIALNVFLFSTLMLVLFIACTIGISKTKDPFYPCQSSTSTDNIFSVFCNNMTGKRVKTAFQNSKIYRIDQFVFNLGNKKDQYIPGNVIGNHSIGMITLQCSGKNSPLRVDSAAFSLTKLFTDTLNISNCNLQYLDWSFLKGFSSLRSLHIVANSSNLHQRFHTLPTRSLAKLKVFQLDSVLGLNGFNRTCLKFPAPPPKGLTALYIDNCYDVGTAALQNFLAKWVTPTETLQSLSLTKNSLSRIPSEVSKYVLSDVDISGNLQPLKIQDVSFNVFRPYSPWPGPNGASLILRNSKITYISPGTFKGGDYTWAYIDLRGNQLTKLDFGVLAYYYYSPSLIFIQVEGNPFDCVNNQCNLGWLIGLAYATCSNGTVFSDLNTNNLRYPNGTMCR